MEYVPAKTLLTRTKDNSWFGYDYNMNIYRGCCHGCIYCDSRSDCYHVDNFDTVRAKRDAMRILRDELNRKVRSGVISTGAMSDPYNPFEKKEELTRRALELISAFEFGIGISTKSPLITRDMDVLGEIRKHSPVLCKVTVTAAEDETARKIEPHVAVSSQRFSAVARLSEAGIFTGVLLMPVLPFITDTKENITAIVRKAKESGARFIYPSFGVTLRMNQREYYYEQLDREYPGLSGLYRQRFGDRYHCGGRRAKELYLLFQEECTKAGLLYKMQDIISAYKSGYGDRQLSFF